MESGWLCIPVLCAALFDQWHLYLLCVWSGCLYVALDVQGLYRLSGSKSRMERICQLFEAVADRVDLSEQNPHLVASVLKLYLRKLPEPLMTFALYDEFISITKVSHSSTLMQLQCVPCARIRTYVFLTCTSETCIT